MLLATGRNNTLTCYRQGLARFEDHGEDDLEERLEALDIGASCLITRHYSEDSICDGPCIQNVRPMTKCGRPLHLLRRTSF